MQGHRAVLRDQVHAAYEKPSLRIGRHRVRLDHNQLVLSEGLIEHHRPAGIVWNRCERRLEHLGVAVNHRALDGVALIEDSLRAAVDVSGGVADLHDLLHVEVKVDRQISHLA